MPENKTNHEKSIALVINPETQKTLGRVSLAGDPLPATEWISSNGPLQSFTIIDGWDDLREVWVSQAEVLLRTDQGQRFFKIITYPTEGEDQGYLDFTSELETSPKPLTKRKTRVSPQRGLAYIQSIFSL